MPHGVSTCINSFRRTAGSADEPRGPRCALPSGRKGDSSKHHEAQRGSDDFHSSPTEPRETWRRPEHESLRSHLIAAGEDFRNRTQLAQRVVNGINEAIWKDPRGHNEARERETTAFLNHRMPGLNSPPERDAGQRSPRSPKRQIKRVRPVLR
jgi:hypothetical protein